MAASIMVLADPSLGYDWPVAGTLTLNFLLKNIKVPVPTVGLLLGR